MEARIERLEAIVVLLCQDAAHGNGMLGDPFWTFIDDWRREHGLRAPEGFRWQA
jgi:hypothetical protein